MQYPKAGASKKEVARFKDRIQSMLVQGIIDVEELPLEQIKILPQYTIRRTYLDKDIGELAASMRMVGLLQPITVISIRYKEYAVVVGQRRYLAAKLLEWKSILSLIKINL